MSGSPPPPAHEVLSDRTSCTRTCLRGRHGANYERSRVSPWIRGPWTLQGRLLVRASSMVEVSMGHSSSRLLCRKGVCRP